jgi:FMN phosphatase YigB (HAD superfamily)
VIRALTFDLWGTLLHGSPAYTRTVRDLRLRAIVEVASAAGPEVDEAAVAAAYDRAAARTSAHRPHEVPGEVRVRWVLDELGAARGTDIAAELGERGLTALAARMAGHNANGMAIARFLESHVRNIRS